MDSLKKFDYKVIKHIATLSETGSVTKELNLISYAENRPKYDIRGWKTYPDGTRKMLKGLTLTDEEIEVLKTVFYSGKLEGEGTEPETPEETIESFLNSIADSQDEDPDFSEIQDLINLDIEKEE